MGNPKLSNEIREAIEQLGGKTLFFNVPQIWHGELPCPSYDSTIILVYVSSFEYEGGLKMYVYNTPFDIPGIWHWTCYTEDKEIITDDLGSTVYNESDLPKVFEDECMSARLDENGEWIIHGTKTIYQLDNLELSDEEKSQLIKYTDDVIFDGFVENGISTFEVIGKSRPIIISIKEDGLTYIVTGKYHD